MTDFEALQCCFINSPRFSRWILQIIPHQAPSRCGQVSSVRLKGSSTLQAAKQERRRLFNTAERERKSKNKTAAELAHEEREFEVKKKQQVLTTLSCTSTTSTAAWLHCLLSQHLNGLVVLPNLPVSSTMRTRVVAHSLIWYCTWLDMGAVLH